MKTRNISRSALFLFVLMAAFPIASRADSIIFNDFGTGHNYNAKTGLAIGGKNSNPGFVEWGEAFVPKAKFDLSAITMALGSITGSNGVTVSLDSSIGGAPGKTLASWSFLALPQLGTTSSTVQTMTFADAIVLQKGQTYWLVTSPTRCEHAGRLEPELDRRHRPRGRQFRRCLAHCPSPVGRF